MSKELGYATIASVCFSFVTIFFAHVTLHSVRGFGEYKLLSGLNMTILATSSFRNSTTEARIQEIINANPESSIMVVSLVFLKISNLLTNIGPWIVLCIWCGEAESQQVCAI